MSDGEWCIWSVMSADRCACGAHGESVTMAGPQVAHFFSSLLLPSLELSDTKVYEP